jgi:DNA-binding Xre family transcriptional regulator
MKWNLRLAAANRGIWKASELQRMLAERDLVISAGKMSGLWSGDPASIKLSDLDVICAVLGCGIEELLACRLLFAGSLLHGLAYEAAVPVFAGQVLWYARPGAYRAHSACVRTRPADAHRTGMGSAR